MVLPVADMKSERLSLILPRASRDVSRQMIEVVNQRAEDRRPLCVGRCQNLGAKKAAIHRGHPRK